MNSKKFLLHPMLAVEVSTDISPEILKNALKLVLS